VDALAIAGLAGLLLVKEAGVPIPIPGDLLVIGAGIATAGQPATAIAALITILLAGYVGGAIQFLLIRGGLRRVVIGVLTRFGVSEARIEALVSRLRTGGARGVAIARATPGVRVPAIAASGIAALPLPAFMSGLVVGNGVFVSGHFILGFVIGAPAQAFLEKQGLALTVGAFVLFAVLGAIGWLVIRRRGRAMTLTAWADAACPACLTLAVLGRDDDAI
jgi:membrane protein DedA with SNARE-associated domain